MKKRRITKPEREYIERMEKLPDWYWKHGLHDAHITSIGLLTIPIDWKKPVNYHNCLEINVNCSGALFETDIKKIELFNCEITSVDFDLKQLNDTWWMYDEIETLDDGKYWLKIYVKDIDSYDMYMEMVFEKALVTRTK